MFVDAGDVLLHTVAFGPDRHPVLALNGWCSTWEAWAPTFELLSRDRRCISYDTRGSGGSPCAADAITVQSLVDDVFRVLDAQGVDTCVLTGESLGGFIAQLAALQDPERFSGLVLISSAPFVTSDATARWVAGSREDHPTTVRKFVRLCLNEPESTELHPWAEQLFLGAAPECAARLFECCYEVVPDLTAIGLPTTVVHGDIDEIIPSGAGQYLARAIPGARFIELAGTGHAPTVTRPQEISGAIAAVSTD